jgi:hypothetical protein
VGIAPVCAAKGLCSPKGSCGFPRGSSDPARCRHGQVSLGPLGTPRNGGIPAAIRHSCHARRVGGLVFLRHHPFPSLGGPPLKRRIPPGGEGDAGSMQSSLRRLEQRLLGVAKDSPSDHPWGQSWPLQRARSSTLGGGACSGGLGGGDPCPAERLGGEPLPPLPCCRGHPSSRGRFKKHTQ